MKSELLLARSRCHSRFRRVYDAVDAGGMGPGLCLVLSMHAGGKQDRFLSARPFLACLNTRPRLPLTKEPPCVNDKERTSGTLAFRKGGNLSGLQSVSTSSIYHQTYRRSPHSQSTLSSSANVSNLNPSFCHPSFHALGPSLFGLATRAQRLISARQ